jgi:cyclomaltodextrinase / maltogenic alpha-amylase / neopullulanase
LLTIAGGDRASVELATLLVFTFPGAPSIYYGDEIGLPGGLDPDCRRGFPKEENWDKEVLVYHKRLIALRHQYTALRTGDYKVLAAQGSLYVFSRSLNEEFLVIAVNVGNEPAQISVEITDLKSHPENLLYGVGKVSWDKERLSLDIPARTGCIIG